MEVLLISPILVVLLGVLAFASLHFTAPTIFLVPFCVLSAINVVIFESGAINLLIIVAWLLVILALTVFCGRAGIRLGDLRIAAQMKKSELRMQRWRFAICVAGFVVAVAFWISQAGVNALESAKRLDSSDELYMFANFFTGAYMLLPIYVLGIGPAGRPLGRHYIVFSIVILLWALVQGYLSSDRGAFFYPLLLIVLLRICQKAHFADRLRIAMIGAGILLATIPVLAQISSERANRAGEGYEILYDQALNSDMGYGFSANKDATVYRFVEKSGEVLDPVYLFGGIYGLVPRIWWENKPAYVGTGPIAGSLVFRESYFVTRGAGIPVSMPAEFAMAFGTSFFWIGLLCYVIAAGAAALVMRRWPLLCVPIVLFIAQLAGGGLPKSISVFLMNFLGLLIIAKLLKLRVVRLQKFDRRPAKTPMPRVARKAVAQ